MTKSEMIARLEADIAYQRSQERLLDPPDKDMEYHYRQGLEYARNLLKELTSLD